MTITLRFDKPLPAHLAVAFATALMSMQDETCNVFLDVRPARKDHLPLQSVSGMVVCSTMWEVPLGEIFSAFDVEVTRE